MSESGFKIGEKVRVIGASECERGCCRAETFVGFITESRIAFDRLLLYTIREHNEGPTHYEIPAWRVSAIPDGR